MVLPSRHLHDQKDEQKKKQSHVRFACGFPRVIAVSVQCRRDADLTCRAVPSVAGGPPWNCDRPQVRTLPLRSSAATKSPPADSWITVASGPVRSAGTLATAALALAAARPPQMTTRPVCIGGRGSGGAGGGAGGDGGPGG